MAESTRPAHVLVLIALLVGCGAGQAGPAGRAGGAQEDTAPDAPPSSEHVSPSPATPENPQLASALEELCRVVTGAVGDRSGAVVLRIHRGVEQFRASPHGPVFTAFIQSMEGRRDVSGSFIALGPHAPTFEAYASAAAAQGVPGFECAPFRWYLAADRFRACKPPPFGEPRASAADDLALLCSIADALAEEAEIDEVQILNYFIREVACSITNEAVCQVIFTWDSLPPDERRDATIRAFDQIAAEAGLAGWRCPKLNHILRSYAPAPP